MGKRSCLDALVLVVVVAVTQGGSDDGAPVGAAASPPAGSRSATPEPWAAAAAAGSGGRGGRPGGASPQQQPLLGGTLVVCPTTVLHQWYREISDKVNRQTTNMTVHIYHGKARARTKSHLLPGHGGAVPPAGCITTESRRRPR